MWLIYFLLDDYEAAQYSIGRDMNKKIVLLIALIILVCVGIAIGIYFLGRTTNRTSSVSKATVVSQLETYPVTFRMTDAFADFLYDRGFWKNDGIRLNKQKQAQKVDTINIVLKDKAGYRGSKDPALPIILSSNVVQNASLKTSTYNLDVFVDTKYVKRYTKKDLERNIFLAVLSQVYEDTARTVTSYEGRIAKNAQITKIAELPGANPFTIVK